MVMRVSCVRIWLVCTCERKGDADERIGFVLQILAKKEFQEKGWTLAPREEVLPTWERRGIVEECGGDASTSFTLSLSLSSILLSTNLCPFS